MSDFIPPNYSKKQLNLQMVNGYVHIHDLMCHCQKPLKHIIEQIYNQEPTLQKWPDTTTAGAGAPDGDADTEPFGEGELEALFAEENDGKDR